jgi:hypothetical protein
MCPDAGCPAYRLFDEHTLFFGSTNVCEFEGFCLGSLSDGSWGCRWYTHPYNKGNSLVCDELFFILYYTCCVRTDDVHPAHRNPYDVQYINTG